MMLCIDGLFFISSVSHELNERLLLNGYLAFDKLLRIWFCDIFMYMWPHFPMVMCTISTIYIIFECWFISGLVKSLFEGSLSGKKSQFLSKVVFAITSRFTFHNLGTFWVLTNWHRCRGTKVHICPVKNDRVWRKISVGKQEFLSVKKVVYFPWRLES